MFKDDPKTNYNTIRYLEKLPLNCSNDITKKISTCVIQVNKSRRTYTKQSQNSKSHICKTRTKQSKHGL